MVTGAGARVLVVSPPGGVAGLLVGPLAEAGCDPFLVDDFGSAKTALSGRPALLVTDLKLGAYNGLHLAIRAAQAGIAAVIIGQHDPVLQADAARQHALYITVPVDLERTRQTILKMLEAPGQARRSERRQVPGLHALVNEKPARLLDVSYDGMRLEGSASDLVELPTYFQVRLPQFNFACRVQRIWTLPPISSVQKESFWCGAALAAVDFTTTATWRTLVDGLPV